MNPNETTRSSHPSSAQLETLVEFMERNPGMAKGFLRTQNARERSRRQWEELAVRLNSLGGTIKNYKQWTKLHVTQRQLPPLLAAPGQIWLVLVEVLVLCHHARHTSSVAGPPPSQRRTEFSTTTERFLRVEEQQLEIQRLHAQILQSFLERNAERDRAMDERGAERDRAIAEAVAAVGKGLQSLAEARNRDPE